MKSCFRHDMGIVIDIEATTGDRIKVLTMMPALRNINQIKRNHVRYISSDSSNNPGSPDRTAGILHGRCASDTNHRSQKYGQLCRECSD